MPLTSEQETKIRTLITRTILTTVRTHGGGLYTVNPGEMKPDEVATEMSSLGEYEDWCVERVSKWNDLHPYTGEDEDRSFHLYTLTLDLFPMFNSDKIYHWEKINEVEYELDSILSQE